MFLLILSVVWLERDQVVGVVPWSFVPTEQGVINTCLMFLAEVMWWMNRWTGVVCWCCLITVVDVTQVVVAINVSAGCCCCCLYIIVVMTTIIFLIILYIIINSAAIYMCRILCRECIVSEEIRQQRQSSTCQSQFT